MGVKRVLVCPLEWGLGHATRCIPVIEAFQAKGAEVIIAADGPPLALLKAHFPSLETVVLPGVSISYPTTGNMTVHLLRRMPRLLHSIQQEHRQLQQIIRSQPIDLIFSDNRYGLWHPAIPSVFMSHQLQVPSPTLPALVNWMNHRHVNRHTCCWVPDNEQSTCSGKLSGKSGVTIPLYRVGALSRFEGGGETTTVPPLHDITCILSGPEPQRSILESIVMRQLKASSFKATVVRGLPAQSGVVQNGNITIYDHLPAEQMQALIRSAKVVLSRSGYSTIMDLSTVGGKAIFIPTPGQPEQHYLAQLHADKCFTCSQDELDLDSAITTALQLPGFKPQKPSSLLEDAVDAVLSKING